MLTNKFVGDTFYNGVPVDIKNDVVPAKKWGRGARFVMSLHTGKLLVVCYPQGENTFINVALVSPSDIDISESPEEPPILPSWATYREALNNDK